MAEKNSLWKNIRNKAKQNRKTGTKPKKPSAEMLRQEKKIKAQYAVGGPFGVNDGTEVLNRDGLSIAPPLNEFEVVETLSDEERLRAEKYNERLNEQKALQDAWYPGQEYDPSAMEKRAGMYADDAAAEYILNNHNSRNDYKNRQEYLKSFTPWQKQVITRSSLGSKLGADAGSTARMAFNKILGRDYTSAQSRNYDPDITKEDYENVSRWGVLSPLAVPMHVTRAAIMGDNVGDAFRGETPRPWKLASEQPIGMEDVSAINMLGDIGIDPLNFVEEITAAGKFFKNKTSPLLKKALNSDAVQALTFQDDFKLARQSRELGSKIKEGNANLSNFRTDELYPYEGYMHGKEFEVDRYFRRKDGVVDNNRVTSLIEKRNKTQDFLEPFNKEGDLITKNVNSKTSGFTTTGEKTITDFKTGDRVFSKVEEPGTKTTYNINDNNVNSVVDVREFPQINNEYVQTLQNNVKFAEESIPGLKVYGSSKGVTEGGLPHLTNDIDGLITQSNYEKHVKGNYPKIKDNGPAVQHDFAKLGNEEGYVDFNIIHEDANGNVVVNYQYSPNGEYRSLELELFRQFDPEGFYKASKEAIENQAQIKVPYKAQELLDKVDPTIKTIIDSYEAQKTKHLNRIDAYINFGNVDKVLEAQNAYVKSAVGKTGNLGHQFEPKYFANVDDNIRLLNEIEFIGDANVVAKDPKRMQLALNDFYINNSIVSRNVDTNSPLINNNLTNVNNSLSKWYPDAGGGSISGEGLNNVMFGNPQHIGNIISHRQLGLKHNTSSPFEYVKDVKRQTDGNYVFTQDELGVIQDLMTKHFGEEVSQNVKNVRSSRDLLANENYQPPSKANQINISKTNLGNRPDRFFDDVTKELGIRAASKRGVREYGNSWYSSTLGELDSLIDSMEYSVKEAALDPKSFRQRQQGAANSNSKFAYSTLSNIDNVETFKRVSNLLDGGLEKINGRIANLEKQLQASKDYRNSIKNKYLDKDYKKYNQILEKERTIALEIALDNRKAVELTERMFKLKELRKFLYPQVIAGSAVAGGLGLSFDQMFSDNPIINANDVDRVIDKVSSPLDFLLLKDNNPPQKAKGGPIGEEGIPYRPLAMPMESYQPQVENSFDFRSALNKARSNKINLGLQEYEGRNDRRLEFNPYLNVITPEPNTYVYSGGVNADLNLYNKNNNRLGLTGELNTGFVKHPGGTEYIGVEPSVGLSFTRKFNQGGPINPYMYYAGGPIQYKVGGKFWQGAANTLYNAGAGLASTVTGGLTTPFTDKGQDYLQKIANPNFDPTNPDDVKAMRQINTAGGAGKIGGSIAGGILSGNIGSAVATGASGVDDIVQASTASDSAKQWSQGLSGLAQFGHMMNGTSGNGSSGSTDGGSSSSGEGASGFGDILTNFSGTEFGKSAQKVMPFANQAIGALGDNKGSLLEQGYAEQKRLNSPEYLAMQEMQNQQYVNQGLSFARGGTMDPPDGGPGRKAPIYVSDPNDPRLQAYSDSLSLHNSANLYNQEAENILRTSRTDREYAQRMGFRVGNVPIHPGVLGRAHNETNRIWRKHPNWRPISNVDPGYVMMPDGVKRHLEHVINFQKPVQPVIYEKPRLKHADINRLKFRLSFDSPEDMNIVGSPKELPPIADIKEFNPSKVLIREMGNLDRNRPEGEKGLAEVYMDDGMGWRPVDYNEYQMYKEKYPGANTTKGWIKGNQKATGGNITNNSVNLQSMKGRYSNHKNRYAEGGVIKDKLKANGIVKIPSYVGYHSEHPDGGQAMGRSASVERDELVQFAGGGHAGMGNPEYVYPADVDNTANTNPEEGIYMPQMTSDYKMITDKYGMPKFTDKSPAKWLEEKLAKRNSELRVEVDGPTRESNNQAMTMAKGGREVSIQANQLKQQAAQADAMRIAEEEYAAAYGGTISKKYKGLNMPKKAKGGYVYNAMTEPMLAHGGPMVSNVQQPFNGPAAQNRGGMMMAQGGMMQQQGGQNKVMQLVQAYAEATGISLEEIMQQLQQMEPQDQQQAIQQMAQELQGGQQQPMQSQQMMPQQGMMANGGMMYAQGGPGKRIIGYDPDGQPIYSNTLSSPNQPAAPEVNYGNDYFLNRQPGLPMEVYNPNTPNVMPNNAAQAEPTSMFSFRDLTNLSDESADYVPLSNVPVDAMQSIYTPYPTNNPSPELAGNIQSLSNNDFLGTDADGNPVSINPDMYYKYQTGQFTPEGYTPSPNKGFFSKAADMLKGKSGADALTAAAQLAGPLSQFFQKKPEPFQYNKGLATTLDPTTAIILSNEEQRRAQDTAGYNLKQNAPNSGSYMANMRALGLGAGKQRGATAAGIRQQYDVNNAGILNQFEQFNTGIENANIDAMQQDQANFQEQRTNALYNAGANIAGMRRDYKTNQINEMIANNIGTNNWKYDPVNQTITYRASNGEMVTAPAASILGTNPTNLGTGEMQQPGTPQFQTGFNSRLNQGFRDRFKGINSGK